MSCLFPIFSDFLLPSSTIFLQQLPYLYSIHRAATAPQSSFRPGSFPSSNSLGVPASGLNRWSSSVAGSIRAAPIPVASSMARPYVAPQLSEFQKQLLRIISTYHPRTPLDQLVKQQNYAIEQLQQQVRFNPHAAAVNPTPTAELAMLEVEEEIEDFDTPEPPQPSRPHSRSK